MRTHEGRTQVSGEGPVGQGVSLGGSTLGSRWLSFQAGARYLEGLMVSGKSPTT